MRTNRTISALGLALAVLVQPAVVQSQELKLRVLSADSALSRFSQRGFLKGTVYVEGTIVPLKGVALTLSEDPVDSSAQTTEIVIHGRSDQTGSFAFDLAPEGQYYLEARFPGYFPYSESVWIVNQELTDVVIELVPDYSHPSFHKTGSIQFEIFDRGTGETIEASTINFISLHELINTGSSGTRFVHLLRPGRYHFTVTADNYRESAEDSVLVAAGNCIAVPVGLRDRVLSLEDLLCSEDHRKPYPVSMIDPAKLCTITGRLVDPEDGQGIPFEQIYLAPYGIVAETDSTGEFTIHGLRPGVYCATARVPGYYRTTEHGIELVAGKTKRIRLPLRREPGMED